jgi:hypothetical protein
LSCSSSILAKFHLNMCGFGLSIWISVHGPCFALAFP